MSRTTQVKLSVEPLLRYRDGPSTILALLTEKGKRGTYKIMLCVCLGLATHRQRSTVQIDSSWALLQPARKV